MSLPQEIFIKRLLIYKNQNWLKQCIKSSINLNLIDDNACNSPILHIGLKQFRKLNCKFFFLCFFLTKTKTCYPFTSLLYTMIFFYISTVHYDIPLHLSCAPWYPFTSLLYTMISLYISTVHYDIPLHLYCILLTLLI